MSRISPPQDTREAVRSSKRKRAAHEAVPGPRLNKKPALERQHESQREPEKRSFRNPKSHEPLTVDSTMSKMSAAMLSDYLAQQLKRHSGDRTSLELEDQFIPASAIRDTSSFIAPRVSKHLVQFLHTVSGGDRDLSTCDQVASPHTIIITASGIRAAHLTRELRPLASADYKIGKLFAKHLKLQDTIDFVQKNKVIIGVGTPARLKELIDHDAIKATGIKRIVIDGSHVDEKKRTIFDMKEIYMPMLELLNTAKVKSRLATKPNGLEIIVF